MCVCKYAYLCMYVVMRWQIVCVHAHMYIRACKCAHIYIYAYVSMRIYTCT